MITVGLAELAALTDDSHWLRAGERNAVHVIGESLECVVRKVTEALVP